MSSQSQNLHKADFILFTSMLLGIVAKDVWDNINQTGSVSITFPRIIAALIVSPIVFLTVSHYFSEHRQITIITLALAFQSGFFWQSIFATAQGRL